MSHSKNVDSLLLLHLYFLNSIWEIMKNFLVYNLQNMGNTIAIIIPNFNIRELRLKHSNNMPKSYKN